MTSVKKHKENTVNLLQNPTDVEEHSTRQTKSCCPNECCICCNVVEKSLFKKKIVCFKSIY